MVDSRQRRKRFAVAAMFIGGLLPLGSAYALEFGRLRLSSHLGQPLDARIVLSALTPAERDSLAVHIASSAMFKRFNIKRSADIDQLGITTRKSGDKSRVIVHIQTRRPVQEPFLDFLLEADSNDGHALREYTVLLDPMPTAPAPAVPAPVKAATVKASARTVHAGAVPVATQARKSYGPVRAGDTLWSIAARLRPKQATIEQTLIAIYRANPDAFSGGINTLQKGVVLTVPTAAAVRAIDQNKAEKRIRSAQDKAAADDTQVASAPAASGQASPQPQVHTAAEAVKMRTVPPPPLMPEFERRSWSGFKHLAATANALGIASAKRTTVKPARMLTANTAIKTESTAIHAAPSAKATVVHSRRASATPPLRGEKQAAPGLPIVAAKPTGVPKKHKPAKTKTHIVANRAIGDRTFTDRAPDVAAADESSLASPRHLLWLLVIAGLIALVVIWWRRRQYQPMPLDPVAPDSDDTINQNADAQPLPAAPVVEPEPAPAVAVATAPEPAEPEPTLPVTAIDAADAYLQDGEFSQARALLEAELEHKPRDGQLQDKLLEVDYQAGDARRFGEDVARFEHSLKTNGLRWANVAAMGRVLLPGDARFEIEALDDIPKTQNGPTAARPELTAADDAGHSGPELQAFPAARPDRPAAQFQSDDKAPVPARDTGAQYPADGGNHDTQPGLAEGFDLDIQAKKLDDDNPWPTAPDHGGPEVGFTLDRPEEGRKDNHSSAQSVEPPHPATLSLDMIDPGDFDLEMGASPAEEALDADTIEARLDLARMYIEMEDQSMARGLLEEVIANGDDAQRDTARALLESL